jgi:hypothetical protein
MNMTVNGLTFNDLARLDDALSTQTIPLMCGVINVSPGIQCYADGPADLVIPDDRASFYETDLFCFAINTQLNQMVVFAATPQHWTRFRLYSLETGALLQMGRKLVDYSNQQLLERRRR